MLREKNTYHKLMSELENMGYDLHQEHSNVSREKYLQFKVLHEMKIKFVLFQRTLEMIKELHL